jgi:UDP-N-acetylglucosamine 2-epimerase (non-hydrolysing)
MIHFFVGTKAQFIKTSPVMLELDRRGVAYRYIDSGQHGELTAAMRRALGVREPDVFLAAQNRDIAQMSQGLTWLAGSAGRWAVRPGWIRNHVFGGERGICVVHGDTASTLVGAMYARRAGLDIAHLEAGLRSFNLWHPFPEELIRIRCMRMANLLFAPDDVSMTNLAQMNVRGRTIHTHGNTVLDALHAQGRSGVTSGREPQSFVVATCHRLETLRSRQRFAGVVDCLNLVAETTRVVFVQHKPTIRALDKFGLSKSLHPNIERLPMQMYFDFVALLRDARFVMADGGSIQEECAALGVPLLILREHTERQDGCGINAQLAGFDPDVVEQFMGDVESRRNPSASIEGGPSSTIADRLIEYENGTARPEGDHDNFKPRRANAMSSAA